MEDFDEATKAKRRKEQIEFRNKKRTSNIFMFFATILEIVITLAVIAALFIIFALLLFKVFKLQDSQIGMTIFEVGSLVVFIGGMVLGFMVYKRIIQLVIEKKHLEDKLSNEVLFHYKKQTAEEKNAELKK